MTIDEYLIDPCSERDDTIASHRLVGHEIDADGRINIEKLFRSVLSVITLGTCRCHDAVNKSPSAPGTDDNIDFEK